MRISDWSSDLCSSDLGVAEVPAAHGLLGDMDRRVAGGAECVGHAIGVMRRAMEGQEDVSHCRFLPRFHRNARTGLAAERSEERRGGKECGSTCRFRWWPAHKKTKHNATA